MSLLDPFSHALAAVIAAAQVGLTSLGADPTAGITWLLAIAAVVVAVRVALLPLVVHGVRLAHASARAQPHLRDLAERYQNRKDPESMRQFLEERRRVTAEHGVSRLGCLPMLIQVPIWFALYRLLADVAGGASVGAMTPELVASLGAATLLGVPLAERGYLGGGATHLAVVAGMAVAAAGLAYITQRYVVAPNTSIDGLPEAVARVQHFMPAFSALGLIVAGGVVPLALLSYWVCNSAWTLGQSAVISHWFPTPGTPAANRAR
jgi:YidC/Oxa1 family membrane protein insertase